MRFTSAFLTVVALLPLAASPAGAREPAFAVVVHGTQSEPILSVEELRAVFLGEIAEWGGGLARPVCRRPPSELRALFDRLALGLAPDELERAWRRRLGARPGLPPAVFGSSEEVLAFVGDSPGAIGYVPAGTPLPEGVRLLEIRGCWACERPPATVGEDEIADEDRPEIAELGDVRFFVVGRCGPAGAGRTAVLENRSSARAIEATVEVATRIADALHRHTERYDLDPLSERLLGCTHPAGSLRKRWALLEVSDGSTDRWRDRRDIPPREAVDVAATGVCGADWEGRELALINHHPRRSVRVTVEVSSRVDRRPHRRYTRTHRLEPGEQVALGCSELGSVTRSIQVAAVAYVGD